MRTIATLALTLAFCGTAAAHIPGHPKDHSLKATLAYQEQAYSHVAYVCKRGSGEVKRWHCAASRWLKREIAETRAALAPPVPYAKWACIHEHEGAWNANTGNGYYGGLQMDWSFMRSHGPDFLAQWGTADRWPVWAQITAAERAYRTRGFSPWPNTARICGLL